MDGRYRFDFVRSMPTSFAGNLLQTWTLEGGPIFGLRATKNRDSPLARISHGKEK